MAAKWDGCPVVACKNDLCHTDCLSLARKPSDAGALGEPADDIQALLDRVRAGSIDAEADIREVIEAAQRLIVAGSWQPIETAPVPPREELLHRKWRCLLLHQPSGRVLSGYGAYAQNNGSTTLVPTYALRWYADEGRLDVGPRFAATHWMPLPKGLPRVELVPLGPAVEPNLRGSGS